MYGFGAAAYGVKNNGFSYLLMFYYNQVLDLPAYLAGLALMIAMIFDGVSDPLVGYWSDNTHSRLGRRHPFMYASALPVAIAYYFLWNPLISDPTEFQLFLYLTVSAILVRFFITLYEIPSSGIVAELTDDYDERTRLLIMRYMFGWYGGLGMAVLAWAVFIPDGARSAEGFQSYGALGSVVIFVAILGSSMGLHRYIPYLQLPPKREVTGFIVTVKELKVTLSNRNFFALFAAGICASVGGGVGTNLDIYMNVHFWEFSSATIAVITGSLFVSATIAPILLPFLTRHLDKKRTAMLLYFCAICWAPLLITLRLLGLMPENGDPMLLYIFIPHVVLYITLLVMYGAVQSSMLADIVENSEMRTGRREEGLFFAARTFAEKAASGIGTLVAGILLDLIQYPRGSVAEDVPAETLFNLGLIYGPTLMLFYFAALGCISFYGITRDTHTGNVGSLEARGEDRYVSRT